MTGKMSRREFMVSVASVPWASQAVSATRRDSIRHLSGAFIDSVGVCTHLGQKGTPALDNLDALLPMVQKLGIVHLRDEAIVTVKTTRDSAHYHGIRDCVRLGMRFSMICFDPNNQYAFTPPSMLADLYDWCDGGIVLFEGSNEPDLSKAPWRQALISREHQAAVYREVTGSGVLKHIPVAGPSYVQGNVALALPQDDICDYANIHAYTGMEHPESTGNGSLSGFIATSRSIFGPKPIIVSEIGFHTALKTRTSFFPVSEEIRTRYLPRTLLWAFLQGITRTYLYELVCSFPKDPANPESAFGLIGYDLKPTSAYNAIAALMAIFSRPAAGGGEMRSLTNWIEFTAGDSDRCSLVFDRPDGATLIPVWLAVSAWHWPGENFAAPLERKTRFKVTGDHIGVKAYRFVDSGTVEIKHLRRENDQYEMLVSDQLTVLEIF